MFKVVDFKNLETDTSFKEDSVREIVIMPILKRLGWDENSIKRSVNLKHPFLKIGSKKEKSVTLIPDYCVYINEYCCFVLDAKSPREKIINSQNVEQVYMYATHPEIRSNYFCLCNGLEFVIYKTLGNSKPLLFFKIEDIENNWKQLEKIISPSSFDNKINSIDHFNFNEKAEFDYAQIKPLREITPKRQNTKRHFGVHPYFTKQPWNVVAEYIKNFTKKGDIVLDSFGGSGTTAIEALMNERIAINIDINPLAIFLVDALSSPIDIKEITQIFEKITAEYKQKEPKNKKEIKEILKDYKKYPYPKNVALPKNSDVEFVNGLFNDEQLAKLSLLKSIIKKNTKNDNNRKTLMLIFSGMINRFNLTYHKTKDGGGTMAPFMYYRYRIAPKPTKEDFIKVLNARFKKIIDAKKDIEYFINNETIKNLQNLKGSADDLNFIENESIDYIYTDPPYGKKIAYLDLSIMWNSWLDLKITEEDYKKEAIEGGEHNKSKNEYKNLMAKSIKEMYRVLKYDRWLSFVFAHKDPEFWHLIIETAESCGFEYINAVSQKNTSNKTFRKHQNPFTVLHGELIINFRKTKNPKAILKANLGVGITELIIETIEGIIARDGGATSDQISDELIIKGLELGFLDLLSKEYNDKTLDPFLMDNFDYDEKTKLYTIKKNAKFKSHIPLELRIHYYLLSYLRRKERTNENAKFDNMILEIMPLLKNGTTPSNQTILSVLERIAYKTSAENWKLKDENGQGSLF